MSTRSLRILCADDNLSVLSLLRIALEAAGHHVDVATNGRDAVDRIRVASAHLDLVITDKRMPSVDGFGVVATAKELGFQVIAIASRDDAGAP